MASHARFLLLLGSSRGADALLVRAIDRLAAFGDARLVTPIGRYAADDGSALRYYNALATWDIAAAGAGHPRRLIHGIEAELGRDRTRRDDVAIDIDLLAVSVAGTWHAHPHALAKGEFARNLVRGLLRDADIAVAGIPAATLAAGSDVQ